MKKRLDCSTMGAGEPMKRKQLPMAFRLIGAAALLVLTGDGLHPGTAVAQVEDLLLDDFRPRSIYRVPVTEIEQARFPVVDMHSHAYAESQAELERWVRNMDEVGIERTVILTGAVGDMLDSLYQAYSQFGGRFEVWCGLDLRGYDESGFGPAAVAELERCVEIGGRGVGEISDKGKGIRTGGLVAEGMHPDDPRMDPIWQKAAELGLPINLHVADPMWMYLPMDSTNDGLMTAYRWRLDNQPDIVDHAGMMQILDRTLARHPNTTFIVVHYANLTYDLAQLAALLARHPNMYIDVSARYAEISQIPRAARRFIEAHADRILYGTDLGYNPGMYRTTFRILETEDEHFYDHDVFRQHWALRGLGLSEASIRKIYRENALQILEARDRQLEAWSP